MSEINTYKYYVGGKFVTSTSGNLIDIDCPLIYLNVRTC